MAAARRIVEAERFVRDGRWQTWQPTLLLGADLAGSSLGIVGLGRIGQAVARRARGFEMKVLYYSRHRKDLALERSLGVEYVELDTLLSESDFVTLHASLSAETTGLISDRSFELMKSSAILINTARGAMVDQSALYRALSNKRIAGAALDVTDPEPIPYHQLFLIHSYTSTIVGDKPLRLPTTFYIGLDLDCLTLLLR